MCCINESATRCTCILQYIIPVLEFYCELKLFESPLVPKIEQSEFCAETAGRVRNEADDFCKTALRTVDEIIVLGKVDCESETLLNL